MKPKASIRLFSARGVPVYAHITLPLGLALVSGFSFRPLAWLGLLLVVLVHEVGHSELLRRFRRPVLHIVLHGFGGECVYVQGASAWERAVVAWGGVLAQMVLFGIIVSATALGLWPRAFTTNDFYTTVTGSNLLIAAINLLPIRGLDGNEAWSILRLTYLRVKQAWLRRKLSRRIHPSKSGRKS
jgi:Zn-dependent protease